MKLLHIDSSIQGETSASRTISATIVAQLLEQDPTLAVTYRDLAATPIDHLLPQDLAGAETQAFVDEFLAADIVVIGAGLYNFTIPTQLKAWIDRIVIAGKTFRYGADGVEGLATGKRVFVALARGGVYAPGTPMAAFEHAEAYLRAVLGFIGATPEFVVAEGLAFGEDSRNAALTTALDQARSVAAPPVAA
jgi:FMN-dependent NADH-azoreductase